mgnify:CR=1 FL=1
MSKKFTIDADISCVNLMDVIAPLRCCINSSRDFSLPFYTRKMSSMNRIQSVRYRDHSVLYTYISSKCPMYTFAKLGATLVPMAVPFTCSKFSSLNVKLFISSTFSKMAVNSLGDGLFCLVLFSSCSVISF